jgi:hypothetical protein
MKLQTMNDSSWTVQLFDAATPQKVAFTWTYVFSRSGAVRYRDDSKGWNGSGNWRVEGGKIVTRWSGTKIWEAWDLPLDSDGSTGKRYMQSVSTFALKAKMNVVDVGTVYTRSKGFNTDFLTKCTLAMSILQTSQLRFATWLSGIAIAYGRAFQSHANLVAALNDLLRNEDLMAEALLGLALTFVAGGVGGLVGGVMKRATRGEEGKLADFMVDSIKDLSKFAVRTSGGNAIGVFANDGQGIKISGMPVSPLEWENSVNERVSGEMAVVSSAITEWITAITKNNVYFDASFDPAVEVAKSLVLKREQGPDVPLTELRELDDNVKRNLQHQFEQGWFAPWVKQAKFAGEKSMTYPDGNWQGRAASRKLLLDYGHQIGFAPTDALVNQYCPGIEKPFPVR